MQISLRNTSPVKWLTLSGVFMALTIAVSSFGIPVPGGHLYLCDVIICTAAIVMDPLAAFLIGGFGSFLGDFIFYPLPMFVSLVTHGTQALVISLIVHKFTKSGKSSFIPALIGTIIGGIIMVVGYTLGKIYIYSTFEYAMIKLPYEIAQAALGILGSLFLCYKAGLLHHLRRLLQEN